MMTREEFTDEFVKEFRAMLRKSRMTQSELSERVGVGRSVVCRWASGASLPSLYHYYKVMAILRG